MEIAKKKREARAKKDKDVGRNLRKKLQREVVLILLSSNNKNYKSFKDGNRLGKTRKAFPKISELRKRTGMLTKAYGEITTD